MVSGCRLHNHTLVNHTLRSLVLQGILLGGAHPPRSTVSAGVLDQAALIGLMSGFDMAPIVGAAVLIALPNGSVKSVKNG